MTDTIKNTVKKSRKGIGGAPTKYKKKYCREIIEFMAKGNSAVQFAAHIRVSKHSVYEWAKIYPEFSDAFREAQTLCEGFWEKVIQARSVGKQKGSDPMLMFWMKNRFRWSDRTSTEHSGPGGGPIHNVNVNLENLTDEELDNLERIAQKAGVQSSES